MGAAILPAAITAVTCWYPLMGFQWKHAARENARGPQTTNSGVNFL